MFFESWNVQTRQFWDGCRFWPSINAIMKSCRLLVWWRRRSYWILRWWVKFQYVLFWLKRILFIFYSNLTYFKLISQFMVFCFISALCELLRVLLGKVMFNTKTRKRFSCTLIISYIVTTLILRWFISRKAGLCTCFVCR